MVFTNILEPQLCLGWHAHIDKKPINKSSDFRLHLYTTVQRAKIGPMYVVLRLQKGQKLDVDIIQKVIILEAQIK